MILVVGGGGKLGREVVRQLLAQGERVRVLSRNPECAADLAAAGAEVTQGDLTEPASLDRACRGVDRVLAAAHSMLGRGRYRSEAVDIAGNRALVDAARRAKVKHFVLVSILNAAPDHPVDFWRAKYAAEDYLKASGLSYTILRPAAFMETHAHELNGRAVLKNGKTMVLGCGTRPRNFVAVRDVAYFAVLALCDPRLSGRTLDVGGPGNFTDDQVAAVYGEFAGVRPKVRHLPAGVARGASVVIRPFHPGIGRVLYIGSLDATRLHEEFDPAPLLAEFPVELTTLTEFVSEKSAGGSA